MSSSGTTRAVTHRASPQLRGSCGLRTAARPQLPRSCGRPRPARRRSLTYGARPRRTSAACQACSSGRGSYRRSRWVSRSSARRSARAAPVPRRARGPAPGRCPGRSPRPARRPPGSPQASAVSWQSSALRAPPPTTWMTSTSRPDSSWRLAARRAGRPARGCPGCSATVCAGLCRRLLPEPPAGVGDPGGHVARRQEDRVVGVDDGGEGRHRRRPRAARSPDRPRRPRPARSADTPAAATAPSRCAGIGRCRRRRARW